jgi:hypothetical protein
LDDVDGELSSLQRILGSYKEWDFGGGNKRTSQINQGLGKSTTQID